MAVAISGSTPAASRWVTASRSAKSAPAWRPSAGEGGFHGQDRRRKGRLIAVAMLVRGAGNFCGDKEPGCRSRNAAEAYSTTEGSLLFEADNACRQTDAPGDHKKTRESRKGVRSRLAVWHRCNRDADDVRPPEKLGEAYDAKEPCSWSRVVPTAILHAQNNAATESKESAVSDTREGTGGLSAFAEVTSVKLV